MTEEKQIDEIAKLICSYPQCINYNVIGGCKAGECRIADNAENVYNADYHKQEWISVDERLPEKDGKYLTFTPFENKEGGMIHTYWFTVKERSIFSANSFETIWKVTHWMPLPEAPKMKGGAE